MKRKFPNLCEGTFEPLWKYLKKSFTSIPKSFWSSSMNTTPHSCVVNATIIFEYQDPHTGMHIAQYAISCGTGMSTLATTSAGWAWYVWEFYQKILSPNIWIFSVRNASTFVRAKIIVRFTEVEIIFNGRCTLNTCPVTVNFAQSPQR